MSARENEIWRNDATNEILRLAKTGREFDAEDVRSAVGSPPGHPNLMGVAFRGVSSSGLIKTVGFRKSTRLKRNAGMILVWQGA